MPPTATCMYGVQMDVRTMHKRARKRKAAALLSALPCIFASPIVHLSMVASVVRPHERIDPSLVLTNMMAHEWEYRGRARITMQEARVLLHRLGFPDATTNDLSGHYKYNVFERFTVFLLTLAHDEFWMNRRDRT